MSAVTLLLALLVMATGLDRTVDPGLTAIAERRVVEIQADFSHIGYDPCCAEVIAWNAGQADPVARLVEQWRGSSAHWTILTDPSYPAIGCAVAIAGERTYGVCILGAPAGAGVTTEPAPPPSAPAGLPDTAMAAP